MQANNVAAPRLFQVTWHQSDRKPTMKAKKKENHRQQKKESKKRPSGAKHIKGAHEIHENESENEKQIKCANKNVRVPPPIKSAWRVRGNIIKSLRTPSRFI